MQFPGCDAYEHVPPVFKFDSRVRMLSVHNRIAFFSLLSPTLVTSLGEKRGNMLKRVTSYKYFTHSSASFLSEARLFFSEFFLSLAKLRGVPSKTTHNRHLGTCYGPQISGPRVRYDALCERIGIHVLKSLCISYSEQFYTLR